MGRAHGGPDPPGGRPLSAGGPGSAVRSLAAVLRNPDLRALELAWTLGVAADWVLTVTAMLLAYQLGGAALVGLVALVRQAPATLVSATVDTSRLARPERAIVAIYAIRVGAGLVMVAGALAGSPVLVFLATGTSAGIGSLVRPTKYALAPAVARTPDELVATNVVGALGQGIGSVAGPLAASIAVAAGGPAAAPAITVVLAVVAGLIVARVRVAPAARPRRADRPRGLAVSAGVRTLWARRPALAMAAGIWSLTAVRGALTTYFAIMSLELLGLGPSGVGTLSAALGFGSFAGALVALAVGLRRGLAPMHTVALLLIGLPVAASGVVPVPALVFAALAAAGVGQALLDIASNTLLQRGVPGASRGAAFGAIETGSGLANGLGGLLASVLVAALGIHAALVVTGLAMPLVALVTAPFARRLAASEVVPARLSALLRAIPLFAPLPLAALERLVMGLRPASWPAGARLMTEGEPGDRYVIVERGHVAVSAGGAALRRLGPGEGIGEIALLRDSPRTATVDATEPVEGWTIDRETFLDAVTGHEGSAAAAESVVSERLARGGSAG